MFGDAPFALTPVSFFQMESECERLDEKSSFPHLPKKKYLLPRSEFLCDEESFSDVSMGWGLEGLEFYLEVFSPVKKVFHPDVSRGDSIELFIDTRDVKTSGYNTRFCHHFYFLPESSDGKIAGELTRFRTQDKHEWCHPSDLILETKVTSSHYKVHIFIPAHCLVGYDPEQFNRLGFTYRINRYGDSSQHFSASTVDYPIDQQPSLWSSMKLKG